MRGRLEASTQSLRFEAGDSSVSPLFVVLTRGWLEANNTPGVSNLPPYVHGCYYCDDARLRQVSALRYKIYMGDSALYHPKNR